MTLKNIVITQYKGIVDKAAAIANRLSMPKEGWIRTVRKALGMSVVQLASRLNVSRAFIFRTEKAELYGSVTLKTMHKMAEAMDCHFVYSIVPKTKINDLVLKQARLKAKYFVNKANLQMALEDQLLSQEKINYEIDRLTKEILKELPSDLWDIEWTSKK